MAKYCYSKKAILLVKVVATADSKSKLVTDVRGDVPAPKRRKRSHPGEPGRGDDIGRMHSPPPFLVETPAESRKGKSCDRSGKLVAVKQGGEEITDRGGTSVARQTKERPKEEARESGCPRRSPFGTKQKPEKRKWRIVVAWRHDSCGKVPTSR